MLKNSIYRYLSHTQKERYIKKLPDLVSRYNQSFHSTICMAPSEVNKLNERALWWYMYWPKSKNVKPQKNLSQSLLGLNLKWVTQ